MSSRVLLITPEFNSIEKKIKSVIEESGYEVIWMENKILTFDCHGTNSKFKFLRRIYFFLFFPDVRYIKKELKKIENIRFDILFSINGHIICPYLFRKLKSKNPKLFSVLYLWDAFSMYKWTRELKYFNKVYPFDPADSEKYRIDYKPNFYVNSIINKNHEQEYDLFFAGKFNPYRLSVVDKIVSQAENSCDDPEIIEKVENYGIKVPFVRPSELATDTSTTQEVIEHALNFYKQKERQFKGLVLLQPTFPLRKSCHIIEALELFSENIDLVVSVKIISANPYYVLYEENSGGFLELSKKSHYIRRQDCPIVYERNGWRESNAHCLENICNPTNFKIKTNHAQSPDYHRSLCRT